MEKPRLTRGQRQILELAADGLTTSAIGERLGIRPDTVQGSYARIFKILGARNNVHMVALAIGHGLVPPPRPLNPTTRQERSGRHG